MMERRVGRLRWRRSSGRLAVVIGLVAGCSAAPNMSWTTGATLDPASPAATAIPDPTGTPVASVEPQPSLSYPEVQSRGELTITFESPAAAAIALPIACEWTTPDRVGWLTVLEQAWIAGEPVQVDVNLVDPQNEIAATSAFWISREAAAAYAAWPAGATGTVAFVERAPGDASGTIRFDELRPEIESAPPGPLPTPLDMWARPLGGDADYQTISGEAAWVCQPAPATVPRPGPVVTEEPLPTLPVLPKLRLVAGEQRETGLTGCGGSFSVDGSSGSDSCGPSFQAPGDDRIVRIAAGQRLRFALPQGWSFTAWRLGWVLQSEAERFRAAVPDSYAEYANSEDASGRVIELEAPPTGDWTVLLTWSATRGADEMSVWPDYFRVIVEGG